MNTKEAEAEAPRGIKSIRVRLDAALALLLSASFPSTARFRLANYRRCDIYAFVRIVRILEN